MDPQGEETGRDCPPALTVPFPLAGGSPSQQTLSTGWESRVQCLGPSSLFSPRQPCVWSVFTRDHRTLRSRLGPSFTTWSLWLPPNKATRFKHEAHTPPAPTKAARKKPGPNDPSVLRMGTWQGLVMLSEPCQGWRGRGDLGTGLGSAFKILRIFFLIIRKPFHRKTFFYYN